MSQAQVPTSEGLSPSSPEGASTTPTSCCIVGGGPAGAVLALLLARQGVAVTLLEAHHDFEREFRGDTIHPSVMEILDEIGLAERLLQLPHTKLSAAAVRTATETFSLPLLFGKTKFPYIVVMAQARFLDFITTEAAQYPNFRLLLGAPVTALLEEDGMVCGVRYGGSGEEHTLRAALVVAADGRFSRIRKLAGLTPIKTAPPIDILWLRLPRQEADPLANLDARIGAGLFAVLINRFDYWQVGCVIPKGGYQQLRAAGLEAFRQALARAVPEVADRVEVLQTWQQISVLSVESSRLRHWYKPGLLLIGDAAHVMSPAGGVGINYAIADAVVAANVLGAKLRSGTALQVVDLAEVQRQREIPTRFIQAIQGLMQRAVLARAARMDEVFAPPLAVKLLLRLPWLTALPSRIIGFGLWPPHVRP
jgi:2-polyprenyl-6-methoxyphenol hydroxylase-like FAD-dependent oxidoreductase